MKTNNQKLLKLMFEHGLDATEVAEMLGVMRISVYRWRAKPGTTAHYPMPDKKLKKLQGLLEGRVKIN